MTNNNKECKSFYGTTTLGEKGQIVIPADARKKMKLEKGDRLLVFGFCENMIAFSKLENLEKFASHLSSKLKFINEVIKKIDKK
jgi:AbrB family looped-hinge helix DNA binding protein